LPPVNGSFAVNFLLPEFELAVCPAKQGIDGLKAAEGSVNGMGGVAPEKGDGSRSMGPERTGPIYCRWVFQSFSATDHCQK